MCLLLHNALKYTPTAGFTHVCTTASPASGLDSWDVRICTMYTSCSHNKIGILLHVHVHVHVHAIKKATGYL